MLSMKTNFHRLPWAALLFALLASASLPAADVSLREPALQALRRGADFFSREVSVQGTYLWQYSEDLAKREGEGKATATQGWVQPPGTPSVGQALLDAHAATGEERFLTAATETARALVRGQLRSGGWAYHIDFDPQSNKPLAYRQGGGTSKKARNYTILDDDTTQAALRFLMHSDRALAFKDANIHEAARFALESLLRAQHPNGAFSQVYDAPAPPNINNPGLKAGYPAEWPRTYPGGDYWRFYTFNDNLLADVIDTFFAAHEVYKDAALSPEWQKLAADCRAAAEKAGEFMLLAQMPDPQPAWAQQYNFEMHPVWARKFEPASVTGGESQNILRILMTIYRRTGDKKYLEPIPRALAYLQRSRLPDGRLARFYELKTNRPLYFTKNYQLTYDGSDVPTHYAFVIEDRTAAIAREYQAVLKLTPAELATGNVRSPRPKLDNALVESVRKVLAAQDERGRWVEEGRLRYHGPNDPTTRVIRCDTFIRNVGILSRYLAAIKAE